MNVAIVGGGLAGISAAVALLEAGADVDLYEARPRLGGATHSFRRGDLTVDNGQHVFLRCCTAYQGLLRRIGGDRDVRIQDRFDVTVRTPDGRAARLRRGALPAPLHLLPALLRYGLIPPADRLRAGRAALALDRLDPADPALDTVSAGDWLARHGQSGRARTALWELFVVAALNCGVGEASLAPAAMVIKTGLLGRADAADIGVPAVPLGELHGEAGLRAIERRGGRVHLKTRVEKIGEDLTLLAGGDARRAGAIVVAVPHQAAAGLVPAAAVPGRDRWAGLGSSPIVNVHVVYDRKVMDGEFTAAVDSPVQWVFDRTAVAGALSGQYLAVSVSAAERWIGVPAAEVGAAFLPELARLFPAARNAEVTDLFVTRERHATFRQAPGSGALRPAAATGVPGLFLAGAWTDTGWPDTMEGAVRSGLTAARLARRHLGGVVPARTEQGRVSGR